jgi:pimeloyl-ACP methyl ester carboxylesterase
MAFPDVVVVLPGISGSVLAKDGKEIWGTSGQAIWKAVTSGGESIKQLALSASDDWRLDDLGDGITAPGLVQDLHIIPGLWKIDGYSGLISRLQSALGLDLNQNLFPFPYDWRRDNRVSARRLQKLCQTRLKDWRERSGNDKAEIILVGHSMGGLVARYFLECLGGWKDTRALISFGTPYRGSLNALGYLANGYAKSIGPLNVDLSDTVRSFTAVYQLLPAFECLDMGDGKLRRVGEVDAPLRNVDAVRARQALEFYREMRTAQEDNAKLNDYARSKYEIFPIVGIGQPTFQSARFERGSITLLRAIGGKDDSGDGTVPRISATPLELSSAHREIFVSEVHASLQNFDAALVQLTGVLTGTQIDLSGFNFAPRTISLDLDDVYPTNAITIRAAPSGEAPVVARLIGTAPGAPMRELPLYQVGEMYEGTTSLPPGPYRVTVSALFAEGPISATDVILVVDQRS